MRVPIFFVSIAHLSEKVNITFLKNEQKRFTFSLIYVIINNEEAINTFVHPVTNIYLKEIYV